MNLYWTIKDFIICRRYRKITARTIQCLGLSEVNYRLVFAWEKIIQTIGIASTILKFYDRI